MGSEEERSRLFQLSMKKKWEQVAALYKEKPTASCLIITKSKETALHVALWRYNPATSRDTLTGDHIHIKNMVRWGDLDQLSVHNNKGDTPLHVAAAVGWEEMCQLMASVRPEIIRVRNEAGETPLFVAARTGNLHAYRCIRHHYQGDVTRIARRNDGNTILHAAISVQNFELAEEIIQDCPLLCATVNEEGESPIFVAASKSSAFDISSTQYDSLLYRCLFLHKLKKQDLDFPSDSWCTRTCTCCFSNTNTQTDQESATPAGRRTCMHEKTQQFYNTFLTVANNAILAVLGAAGSGEIKEIRKKQEQHSHAILLIDKLIQNETYYEYDLGVSPRILSELDNMDVGYDREEEEDREKVTEESNGRRIGPPPLLIVAAKRGIVALVEKILAKFPVAMHDVDCDGKNVLMVAAENRHAKVLDYLLTLELPHYMFHKVDNEGNNLLHLAAKTVQLESWRVLGPTRLLQWEYNWYQHVKSSVPPLCAEQENKYGKTPWQIFSSTHEDLMEQSADWHMRISNSYSTVAALVATVAFATSATVPGGLKQETGYPMMLAHREFDVFSVSSLIALCLSLTALLFFLAIMSSPEYQYKSDHPKKLLIGLGCLFASIVSMLVSFLAGHSFVLGEKLGRAALPIYATACAAVTIFAIANLPLLFVVKINLRSLPY